MLLSTSMNNDDIQLCFRCSKLFQPSPQIIVTSNSNLNVDFFQSWHPQALEQRPKIVVIPAIPIYPQSEHFQLDKFQTLNIRLWVLPFGPMDFRRRNSQCFQPQWFQILQMSQWTVRESIREMQSKKIQNRGLVLVERKCIQTCSWK